MTKLTETEGHVRADLSNLHAAHPSAMGAFMALHQEVVADRALSTTAKELIALALAVNSHCDGCIAVHAKAALDAGATRDEITDALGVSVLMGGAPAAVYAAEALTAVDEFTGGSSE